MKSCSCSFPGCTPITFCCSTSSIIGLGAPGPPFYSYEDTSEFPPNAIPGYIISQESSSAIKAAIGSGLTAVNIDPAKFVYPPGKEAYCDVTAGETVVVLDVSKDPLSPSFECLELGSLVNTDNTHYLGMLIAACCGIYQQIPDLLCLGAELQLIV